MARLAIIAALALGDALAPILFAAAPARPWMDSSMAMLQAELTARYGQGQRPRVQRGLAQTARFWQTRDGGADVYESFVRDQFAGDAKALDKLFGRMESATVSLEDHMQSIVRDFRRVPGLDLAPPPPIDGILDGFDPGAHLPDDCFGNKLAFAVLLNFPLTSLEERLREGGSWTSRQWAEAWLAERFSRRIPAEVNQAVACASAVAAASSAGCDLWVRGQLPPGLRLMGQRDLRDAIRTQYAGGKDGLLRQRKIQKLLERIVTQTIPAAGAPPGAPAGQRYRSLLQTFQAARGLDPYAPTAPTHIARSFNEGRQLPEARVRKLLEEVAGSPLAARAARLIHSRLGRKLEPFDLWYGGLGDPEMKESELDAITRKRFPTADAYRQDLPARLVKLGFAAEKAEWLAGRMDQDPVRPRPWVGPDGMDRRGFALALREDGRCAERILSRSGLEHPLMAGVPAAAFSDALALVFQARDLDLLGLPGPDAMRRDLAVVNTFWSTFGSAGAALADMDVWQWLYAHPDATPTDLGQAVNAIAKGIWNRYYAPLLGQKGCVLLASRSPLIDGAVDLPDEPLARMIAFQIQRPFDQAGRPGEEWERMARLGRLTPDLWMVRATGSPVGPEALLEAAGRALKDLGQ